MNTSKALNHFTRFVLPFVEIRYFLSLPSISGSHQNHHIYSISTLLIIDYIKIFFKQISKNLYKNFANKTPQQTIEFNNTQIAQVETYTYHTSWNFKI